MFFLSPWSLLWLAAIPILVQLWRMVAVRRRVVVPSLVPFEHLVKRTPKRRGRLVVNLLFWLQLAALIGLAAALAQPILIQPRALLTLAVLDTSASMTANDAFERARRALLAYVAAKSPARQLFIVTTAPVLPLLPQPTGDPVAITRALDALRPSHLGGNLSTAERIGHTLLAAAPDETLIVTDEPPPQPPPPARVRWVSVGGPRPNAAFVGLDAQGPLCSPSDARVIATVQNFSGEAMPVSVRAIQSRRRLAESAAELAPGERRSVSLAIPEGTAGEVELALEAPRDGMDLDNHAWLEIGRNAALPVVIRSNASDLRQTLSTWLGACQALPWTMDEAATDGPSLVITDREERLRPSDPAALIFVPPADRRPVASHWVVSPDHPVGAYLPAVAASAAALNLSEAGPLTGTPVVSALVGGRSVAVVIADEREGRRLVWMRLDPSAGAGSTPLVLVFFNSLRWLLGRSVTQTPGEPLVVGGFASGPVRVQRPDGSTETMDPAGGTVRYDGTTLSGRYRFMQGGREVSAAVNFLDPLESNLFQRTSTWRPLPAAHGAEPPTRPASLPLANWLTLALLVLLLVEWWRYSMRQSTRVASGEWRVAKSAETHPAPDTQHSTLPVEP